MKDHIISNSFTSLFQEALEQRTDNERDDNVDRISGYITEAFTAAECALGHARATKKKPWISEGTLNLIELRQAARISNDFEEEARLHKSIRKSARADRKQFLEDLAGSRTWGALRILRQGAKHSQGRLCDASGNVVSSETRAETFAKYLETVQWAVRPATITDDPPLFEELPVRSDPITMNELRKAVRAFTLGKSSGPDRHPVEYWRAVLENRGCVEGANWLLRLCNMAWSRHEVPQAWHLAR